MLLYVYCIHLVTHPIDTIKVRLQLQGELSAGSPQKYRGFIRGLYTILSQEGIKGLYRGVTASLAREGSYSTIRIGLYEPIKNMLKSEGEKTEPFLKKLLAGGLSGMTGAAIANPTDLIKVRMQAEHKAGQQSHGVISMAIDIFKKEGIKGLYRGVVPTTQRAIVLTAAQLSSYDHSKHLLKSAGLFVEGIPLHFAASMCAGVVCATASAPIVMHLM